MTPVRAAAVQVLLAVERGRTTLGAEVDRARRTLADDRDRALLVELASGTLRWQSELDALLAPCSRRPLGDLDARVRATLRLAAYQLEHLDRVPVHAIVHESVELVRLLGQPHAAGFVNAVLRTLDRTRGSLTLPPTPGPDATTDARLAFLSVTRAHPEWLAARWLDRHGFQAADAWCDFNNRTPDVTLRSCGRMSPAALLDALHAAGVDAAPAAFVRDAIRLPAGSAGRIPAALRGEILLQDEASQIVAHTTGALPEERVLDLCASPGGKTVVLAADQSGRGVLVASDYRPARVRLLHATLARAGTQASVVRLNAAKPLPFGPVFDRVLVDAPCSGLGTLRRDPDLKWSRRPEQLAEFAANESALLARAAEAVKPGGTIVYATCSSEPEENDEVVDAFLARDDRFMIRTADPGPAVDRGRELVDARGFLRTLPFRDGLDAFFAAVLVRQRPA